jgi:hypothetical protein
MGDSSIWESRLNSSLPLRNYKRVGNSDDDHKPLVRPDFSLHVLGASATFLEDSTLAHPPSVDLDGFRYFVDVILYALPEVTERCQHY